MFKIYAPAFRPEIAGIVALYNLRNDLLTLGYSAEIVEWNTQTIIQHDDIIVYPEVISDNPLWAKNVVRYMLNKDGILTGQHINFGPTDFIFTWSDLYHKNAHATLYKFDVDSFFNDTGTVPALDRNIDCTYIGKGGIYGICSTVKSTILIDKTNPISKIALAELLRNTRFLYTYDVCSSITNEAVLCGAMLVPLSWQPYSAQEFDNSEHKFPYITIDNNMISMPIDYSAQRQKLIHKIIHHNGEYLQKLNIVVNKMFNHFEITQ